jgi:DNA-binding MarR family transcriptional regulator
MMDPPQDKLALQPVGRLLSRLGKSYLHQLNAKLKSLDIDRNYYALLLIEQGQGEITQNELAQLLETDKVSIVRVIDYLAAKGYVERIKSISDRRKYCLTLTEKAKKAIPGIKKSINEITSAGFEGLTDTQKSAFYLTLETIKNNLSKANNSGI